jgi:hypothetical protein
MISTSSGRTLGPSYPTPRHGSSKTPLSTSRVAILSRKVQRPIGPGGPLRRQTWVPWLRRTGILMVGWGPTAKRRGDFSMVGISPQTSTECPVPHLPRHFQCALASIGRAPCARPNSFPVPVCPSCNCVQRYLLSEWEHIHMPTVSQTRRLSLCIIHRNDWEQLRKPQP